MTKESRKILPKLSARFSGMQKPLRRRRKSVGCLLNFNNYGTFCQWRPIQSNYGISWWRFSGDASCQKFWMIYICTQSADFKFIGSCHLQPIRDSGVTVMLGIFNSYNAGDYILP